MHGVQYSKEWGRIPIENKCKYVVSIIILTVQYHQFAIFV